MFRFLMIISMVVVLFGCRRKHTTESVFLHSDTKKPYVILIGFDGFRWDYPDLVDCPNLNQMAKEGIRSELKPCFPSKTFPNLYSIVTGLYPDSHGIVQNSFFAADLRKEFSLKKPSTVENPEFYGGEPIWVTAEKQNVRTASFFWVGSEAKIGGVYPTYWKSFRTKTTHLTRIDTLMHWLDLPPAQRPHLFSLYFDEPDNTTHHAGVGSENSIKAIKEMDQLIGVLREKIKKHRLSDSINIIVCSDHGMENISEQKVEVITDYIEEAWCEKVYTGNPVFLIKVKKGMESKIESGLKKGTHFKFWQSKTMPERLHYGKNVRCLDYVLVADSSYSLKWDKTSKIDKATHGYDNNNRNMHAIFYAVGPAFNHLEKYPMFNNIDIYPLIAKIMGLKPAKVDGSIEGVEGMLKK